MRANILTDLFGDGDENLIARKVYSDSGKEQDLYRDSVNPYSDIINPSYHNNGKVLEPYVKKAAADIGRYLKGELGIYVKNFGGVSFKIDDLADTCAFSEDGELKEGIKVLGMYNPETKEITIDKDLYENADRKLVLRVLGEEILHYVQDKLGIMESAQRKYGINARGLIEGSASSIADDLFGEINAYPEEKRGYRRHAEKVGQRDAFLFPEKI